MILPPLNLIEPIVLISIPWGASLIIAYLIGYSHHKIKFAKEKIIENRKDSI